MPIGLDNIQVMSDEAKQKVRSLITTSHDVTGKPDSSDEDQARLKKFKVWDLEFEAQMRMLDNAVCTFISDFFHIFILCL